MAYVVTFRIVDCASPMTLLSGANLSSGLTGLGVADANGERIVTVFDDFQYIVTISKSGVCNTPQPSYIAKNFVISPSMNGTIQTVCLNQGPPAGPCVEGTGIKCFIVTAATGSSESEEVTGLRQLRERVRATSKLGGQLIDVIYDEYAHFSPKIADELQLDTLSRMAVLQIVVKPLFA